MLSGGTVNVLEMISCHHTVKSEELKTLCCIERGQQVERLASYVAAKIACNLTRVVSKVLDVTR